MAGADSGRKQCGACAGWEGVRVRSLRVRARFLKFLRVRAGADKYFQPAQDS